MVHLADRWGIEQIRHSWTYYSPKFKKAAIERVLAGHESMRDVSLDLGLSSKGTLPRWVKEYIANGYNVIEKKKGRKTHGKEETEGSSSEERSPAERNCRSSQAERDPYDTKRILKKLNGLVTEKENQEKKKSREQ